MKRPIPKVSNGAEGGHATIFQTLFLLRWPRSVVKEPYTCWLRKFVRITKLKERGFFLNKGDYNNNIKINLGMIWYFFLF